MPVYKEKNRDTWFCKFYYRDYNGESRQKWKRGFATREDALSYEENFLNYCLSSSADELFSRIYEEYIRDMRHSLKATSLHTKEMIFKNKILPYFGKKKIESITVADVRHWQCMLMNDPHNYRKSYLSSINAQLGTFFNYVNRIYGLPSNPCTRAGTMSGAKSKEVRFWTLEKYDRFRDCTFGDLLSYTCFEVLYWTGIRSGELLALHKG